MTDYFDALAERLHAQGMPADRVTTTVQDLAAHAADSGADPADEFGPPEEFAGRLTAPDAGAPAPTAETWVWTADAFHDIDRLNEFGARAGRPSTSTASAASSAAATCATRSAGSTALGPGAALDAPPPTPARHAYWSGGFASLALLLVAVAVWGLLSGSTGLAAGMAVGGLGSGLLGSVMARRSARRR